MAAAATNIVLPFLLVLFVHLSFGLVLSEAKLDGNTTLSVLLEVKRSFVEDPEKVLNAWSESNPNFCTWRGVSCGLDSVDGSVQVVGLNLSDSSLTGSISPSLGSLQNLLHLDLSSNGLTGPIPPALSNLSSLESLLLFSNQFSGPIPTQLGSLVSLRVMRIGDNELTGHIPASFGNLVNWSLLVWPHAVSTVQYHPNLADSANSRI
ncbi:LRR receptor-like serine/threonine-protein kinase GSO1 [Prunus yedoensis var. nudiflora]|uniref:LRR receptor-like serine/threonine-protein kinase GSO1 n=1 Tax=Prunus yedoensis var. nudiflora TaxID=2094558 RepID=A0A314Y180_PRUYE|nr:LRR receptor-like serine/threonine-protein kinase GSO1 [Prunus yedoensis var. nudiflora]